MNGRQHLRGWGAKLHNSCLETGGWLRELVLDSATFKTKATFKSKTVYWGHWYPRDNPGDIGDWKQQQAAGSGAEPRRTKCDGPHVCTLPHTGSWVHRFFLSSGIRALPCCGAGLTNLKCNCEAELHCFWTHWCHGGKRDWGLQSWPTQMPDSLYNNVLNLLFWSLVSLEAGFSGC